MKYYKKARDANATPAFFFLPKLVFCIFPIT